MKLRLLFKKVKLLFSIFLFFSVCVISAQSQKIITGTVVSTVDGMPLPGASVIVKGTTNGASTDFDGKFSLLVDEAATTLEVSYLGYVTQDVTITNTPITISLQEDTNQLDEVVVVGYGTLNRSDIVSSVAKVELEKALVTPTSDINEMLRGRVAGLKVEVGSGSLRPGGSSDIRLRGQRSIEGNNGGVYVVDGIIRDGGIDDISADDIESVEVLKDASAQAIYGSRGVNGVVLITTKRGKNNKVSVSYHGFITSKSIKKNFDVYNGQEFAQYRREAYRTDNPNDEYEADDFVFTSDELESINTNTFVDWEDELIRNGTVNSQSINLNGGTDLTKVYGSLNYFKEDGIIPTSSFTRKTVRLNVDQKISDRISTLFDISLINSDLELASGQVNVITLSPLGQAYDENGDIKQYPNGDQGGLVNPLWNIREADHDRVSNDFILTLKPRIQLTDDLVYQFTGSVTERNSERGQYLSSLHSSGQTSNGIARIENISRSSFLIENMLTYEKQINEDHGIHATLVQANDEYNFTSTYTEAKDFPNESNGYNGIDDGLSISDVLRVNNKFRSASFMGRLRYNFKDRYLLTATMRADGASVNAEDNKWTYNPAFAFAWKMKQESFLEDVNSINNLKLRLSYGSLANALQVAYTSLFLAGDQQYVFDGNTASGYSPSTVLPNPDLSHEVTTTFNIGADFGLFDNLLEGTVEYYNSSTTDILLRRGVPAITGYTFTYFNGGEVENKGLEISLTANIIRNEDFKWSVSAMYSQNRNELLSLYNDPNGEPILEDSSFGYYVGQALNSYYHLEYDGIWQEGEDFANSPQANPESSTPRPDLGPGDIRIKDTNGLDDEGNLTGIPDGKITAEDRVFTDRNPDWFGSFSTNLSYKGFDLYADFYAVSGVTKVNPFLYEFNNGGSMQGILNGIKVPYYTPENPSTSYPRPSNQQAPNDLFSLAIQDASYFRLRTLTLGYNLPTSAIDKLKLDAVKVYITGTNLFTITDYFGYSPEVNPRDTFSNADTGYPDATAITFGLKIKL